MKANELMIGDLVLYKNKPIIVWEIDEYYDRINTEPDGYNAITCVEIFEVAPIPTTPEILEKIGFWREHNVGYVMEEGEYELIYDLFDHKLRILKNREQILNLEYWDEMCVHELQHAMRLCNIEKKIEL